MASLRKASYSRPLPADAKIITRGEGDNKKKFARFKRRDRMTKPHHTPNREGIKHLSPPDRRSWGT